MLSKSPSPLFVWKLLLIIVTAAGLFFHYKDPMEIVLKERDNKLAQRILRIQIKEGQIGIIFFGDSLIGNALPPGEKYLNIPIARRLKQAGISKPVVALPVTGGGVSFSNLRALADDLIALKPSVIVIQSEMLVPRFIKQPPKQNMKERIGTWSGLLSLELLGNTPQNYEEKPKEWLNQNQFIFGQRKVKAAIERRQSDPQGIAKAVWSGQIVSTKNPEFIAGRELIRSLVRHGIKVIILELPVSQTAVKFAGGNYFKKRTAALDSIIQPGVSRLIYPKVLPDAHFYDYSHMSEAGRRIFIKWFVRALSKELVNYEKAS